MSDEYIDETTGGRAATTEVDSIWLTKPSIKPVVLAAAIMLALIGLFAFRPLMYVALATVVIVSIAWIGESRDESDELPLG